MPNTRYDGRFVEMLVIKHTLRQSEKTLISHTFLPYKISEVINIPAFERRDRFKNTGRSLKQPFQNLEIISFIGTSME